MPKQKKEKKGCHGNCCTCQDCKQHHDDCTCSSPTESEEKILKKFDEGISYEESGKNWSDAMEREEQMLKTESEGWKKEFREYFDKTLKSKKPTMKNLDRELCVDFINKLLQDQRNKLIERIKDRLLEEDVNDHLSDDEIGYVFKLLEEPLQD